MRTYHFKRKNRVLWGCIFLLGITLICCGLTTITYLIFAPTPVDIVFLGLDARPGEGFGARTDSVALVNITPRTLKITLLSIPRDVFIDVPGYGPQRINTINVLGEQDRATTGPDLVKASLQQSFGVGVDRYARIDFGGFVALVDAVGGITVDVPKTIMDYAYPTDDGGTMTVQFDQGRQHMDGTRALQYARTRHQDDDFQRAARQQQVIDALVGKLMSPHQVVRWPQIWHTFRSHVDTDITWWDATRLAPAVLFGWHGHTRLVLNRDYLTATHTDYWVPNYDALADWIASHFD